MKDHERFYVFTGGPGSGKTALIEVLHRAGYTRTVEAGRGIIQDQVAIGGCGLPWQDPAFFAELMLSWEMRSYHLAEQSTGPVFFDRGVVDVVGYLRLMGRPVPRQIMKAAETFRYNRTVFIAPPWQEIFAQDRERKQEFEEAVRTCEAMVAAYHEHGYELTELPRVSVAQRMRFVLQNIGIEP